MTGNARVGNARAGNARTGKALAGNAKVGNARAREDIGQERKGVGKAHWGLILRKFSNFSLAWSGLNFGT